MKIINLTPHPVELLEETVDETRVIRTFPSEGFARCKQIIEESDPIDSIPIQKVRYGSIENLPAPKDSVFYIVSHLVRVARPQRLDLLSPGEVIRDGDGVILGCVNFFRNGHVSKS